MLALAVVYSSQYVFSISACKQIKQQTYPLSSRCQFSATAASKFPIAQNPPPVCLVCTGILEGFVFKFEVTN